MVDLRFLMPGTQLEASWSTPPRSFRRRDSFDGGAPPKMEQPGCAIEAGLADAAGC